MCWRRRHGSISRKCLLPAGLESVSCRADRARVDSHPQLRARNSFSDGRQCGPGFFARPNRMVGKVERRAHRPDGGLAMFEAKPTAGGSGWPQLGAQLPPRGDVTLRSGRIGFGDCLVCIRARAREPVAAVAPATQKAQGHRKRPESQADANNALTRHCQLRVPSQLLSPEIGSAGVLKLESAVQLVPLSPVPARIQILFENVAGKR